MLIFFIVYKQKCGSNFYREIISLKKSVRWSTSFIFHQTKILRVPMWIRMPIKKQGLEPLSKNVDLHMGLYKEAFKMFEITMLRVLNIYKTPGILTTTNLPSTNLNKQ